MYSKKQKRPITLLEIMIVIFLIGLIGGVVGYNMKGSLDEGRAFKTEQAASQIREALLLEMAKGISIEEVVAEPEKYLEDSGFVRDPQKLINDGWGSRFEITANQHGTDINVYSQKLENYRNRKKANIDKSSK